LSGSGVLLGSDFWEQEKNQQNESHSQEQWVLMGMGALGYVLDSKAHRSDNEQGRHQIRPDCIPLKKNTRITCHFDLDMHEQPHQANDEHQSLEKESNPPISQGGSSHTIRVPIVELIHVPCETQKKWLRALMGWNAESNDGFLSGSRRISEWHFGWNESQNDLERFGGLALGRLQEPLWEYCKQMHRSGTDDKNCSRCSLWKNHNWLHPSRRLGQLDSHCKSLHSPQHLHHHHSAQATTPSPKHGQSVFAVGSPFGVTSPKTFSNSITKGVVSNVLGGSEPFVFLTDARMLPGCDGGPIVCTKYDGVTPYQNNDPSTPPVLLGVCALPVRNINEKVEMNVAYAYEPVRRELVNILRERSKWRQNHSSNQSQASELPIQGQVSPQPLVLQHPYPGSISSATSFELTSSLNLTPRQYLSFNTTPERPKFLHRYSSNPRLREAIESVVRVQIANSWASGILLRSSSTGRSFVLTNAHVFAPFLDVDLLKRRKERGASLRNQHAHIPLAYRILMTQHKFDSQVNITSHSFLGDLVAIVDHGPLDLALISVVVPIEDEFSRGIHINYKQRLKTGEDIFIVGHPLYDPNLNLNPTITRGTLAKVVRFGGLPTLIQTSALVHSGNSGGMVMSKEGDMIGIVTANANLYDPNTKTNKLIPSLNFAVPVSRMRDIQDFVDGKISVSQLDDALNRMDKAVARVWSIQESEDLESSGTGGDGSAPGTSTHSIHDGRGSTQKSSALLKYLKEMNQSVPQHMIPKSKL